MKNIAIIFAGGTGKRMNSSDKPKQFLECKGKTILSYTVEAYNNHPRIDGIIVVMLSNWINYTKEILKPYSKIVDIINGGNTGQESIFNGLCKAKELYGDDAIVLIHDGVRPFIDFETISRNIDCVEENRTSITVSNAIETIIVKKSNLVKEIMNRTDCQYARAPQCFILKDIYAAHVKAIQENKNDFIDSACLMNNYGYKLYTVEGRSDNFKITTPKDYYMFCSLIENKES